MRFYTIVVFSAVALGIAGCIPKRHVTVPSVEGKIIDEKTKLPIKNAVVSSDIHTDAQGRFRLEEESELGIGTPMGGLWRISRPFTIKKNGYLSVGCICDTLNSSGACKNAQIHMTKNPGRPIYASSQSGDLTCTVIRTDRE